MDFQAEPILEDAYADASLHWFDMPLEGLLYIESEFGDPADDERERLRMNEASPFELVGKLHGASSREARACRTPPDTLNLLRAAERLASWTAAQRVRLVAEVHSRNASGNHSWSGPESPLAFTETVTEIAALLKLSEGAAARLVSDALTLTGPLRKTLAALEDGRLCAARSAVIVEHSRTLLDEALPEFESEILETASELNRAKLTIRCRVAGETSP